MSFAAVKFNPAAVMVPVVVSSPSFLRNASSTLNVICVSLVLTAVKLVPPDKVTSSLVLPLAVAPPNLSAVVPPGTLKSYCVSDNWLVKATVPEESGNVIVLSAVGSVIVNVVSFASAVAPSNTIAFAAFIVTVSTTVCVPVTSKLP